MQIQGRRTVPVAMVALDTTDGNAGALNALRMRGEVSFDKRRGMA